MRRANLKLPTVFYTIINDSESFYCKTEPVTLDTTYVFGVTYSRRYSGFTTYEGYNVPLFF